MPLAGLFCMSLSQRRLKEWTGNISRQHFQKQPLDSAVEYNATKPILKVEE